MRKNPLWASCIAWSLPVFGVVWLGGGILTAARAVISSQSGEGASVSSALTPSQSIEMISTAPQLSPGFTNAEASPSSSNLVNFLPPQAINTNPEKSLRIGVFGDSLAQGLAQAIYKELAGRGAYSFYDNAIHSTGLANYGYRNLAQIAQAKIDKQPVDVAFIQVGANDRQGITGLGKMVGYGANGWHEAYGQRIDQLTAVFKSRDIAVYWVGLPTMRSPRAQESARRLDAHFKERAIVNGVAFVSIANETAGSDGEYSVMLKLPAEARPRKLRQPDGVHFYADGYRLAALPALAAMQRDLTKAGVTLNPESGFASQGEILEAKQLEAGVLAIAAVSDGRAEEGAQ